MILSRPNPPLPIRFDPNPRINAHLEAIERIKEPAKWERIDQAWSRPDARERHQILAKEALVRSANAASTGRIHSSADASSSEIFNAFLDGEETHAMQPVERLATDNESSASGGSLPEQTP